MASINARSNRRSRRGMSEINMVPFIDVMLVLLTIFMVTAPLITTGNIQLPSVSKAAAPEQTGDVLTLSIKTQGQYQLSSKRQGVLRDQASLTEVLAQIQALQTPQSPSPVVIIASDKTLSYDSVIQVIDALRKAQVQQIGLAVAQP
jgi:biopolymer transport protein TolR